MFFDLNLEFKNYGELKAFQVNDNHIQRVCKNYEAGEIIIKLDDVKFDYKFIYTNYEIIFIELCLLDRFNRILAVAYKNDYVIRNKTETYVLNKEKFEKLSTVLYYKN